MTLRSLLLASTILLTLRGSPAPQAADEPALKLRPVRLVYLVSGDREVNPAYTAALEHAIRDLQKWYARQLDGATFRLHDPVVEVVKSERPAAWFYSNPNGGDQDSWGFRNTLDEASRLVGAKHNDPRFIWVIYSDGPGNKGRGGNGVACLPEDDLLGLVGKHPEQKETLRWIAGLGHELGHAFGLPHPQDTNKHADALMWAGIYGKYPDQTYLTEDDRRILRRSEFFYRADNTPVLQKGKVVARYTYDGGAFEQHAGEPPRFWTEVKQRETDVRHTFEEARRGAEFIFLHDIIRGIRVRLPLGGGPSSFSTDDEKTWHGLYEVSPPVTLAR